MVSPHLLDPILKPANQLLLISIYLYYLYFIIYCIFDYVLLLSITWDHTSVFNFMTNIHAYTKVWIKSHSSLAQAQPPSLLVFTKYTVATQPLTYLVIIPTNLVTSSRIPVSQKNHQNLTTLRSHSTQPLTYTCLEQFFDMKTRIETNPFIFSRK